MGKKFTPALAYDFLTPFFDWVINLLGYGNAFKRMALELSEIEDGEAGRILKGIRVDDPAKLEPS